MRILRVISSIDPKGGGPIEGAHRIDQALLCRGIEVEVVCLDQPHEIQAHPYPTKVHPLGPSKLGYRYNAQLVPWLKANHHRFDAVIVNGLWQYHSFAVWRALASTTTPYFVFSHGMLDPWFKNTYPLKHLKKWLYWPWAEYRVLRDARAVLFTSEEERILARKSFCLYKCREVVTSYGTASPPGNGGELAERFLASNPKLQGKRLLLYLSRIHEKKGCDLLIAAFAKVAERDRSLHLVMAGPDQTSWASKLQAEAASLGVDERISWPGMLQGDMKWGAFHACEAFCLPSHQENFGIVVAEAMGCGKPVLISNKVNIWREIEAEGAGIVNEDTLEGTLNSLNQWLGLSDSQKRAMAQAGKNSFDNRYRIDQVAENLLQIITIKDGHGSDTVNSITPRGLE